MIFWNDGKVCVGGRTFQEPGMLHRQARGDCPKTRVGLLNCTKNKQKMDRKTFERAENHQKNCAQCTSTNEFSDSLGDSR